MYNKLLQNSNYSAFILEPPVVVKALGRKCLMHIKYKYDIQISVDADDAFGYYCQQTVDS
jgi:hypothetical protein